ncbi:hypothetical protein HDU86_001036 [Geranomyces michiganensis]|nr:hypothetical protein HDU86_001036 [Geranomyces michiganensis]
MPSRITADGFSRPLQASWALHFHVNLLRSIGHVIRFLFTRRIAGAEVIMSATIPQHKCLVFHPPGKSRGLYIDFHGGGFVGGVPEEGAEFCKYIAEKTGCIVISAQYRFAPEHPFPTGLNDALAVVQWARKEYPSNKLAVGGMSSGATYALGIAQHLIRARTPLDCVVAFYPVLDFSTKSRNTMKEKNPWIRDRFHEAYLLKVDDDGLSDPLLSPIYAKSEDLPATVVVIAPEIDPNLPDMKLFMERMEKEKGAGFKGLLLSNCFHGWNILASWIIGKDRTKKKWQAYDFVASALNSSFSS